MTIVKYYSEIYFEPACWLTNCVLRDQIAGSIIQNFWSSENHNTTVYSDGFYKYCRNYFATT